MTTRRGDWMQTASGKVFHPLDPDPGRIDPSDVAHALALQCRFAGHTRWHYSVAQHCLEGATRLEEAGAPTRVQLAFLLHDAAEAYCVDVPTPLKRVLSGYAEIEHRVEQAVAERFGLTMDDLGAPIVKETDLRMLATERRDVMERGEQEWAPLPEPYEARIVERPWRDVAYQYERMLLRLVFQDHALHLLHEPALDERRADLLAAWIASGSLEPARLTFAVEQLGCCADGELVRRTLVPLLDHASPVVREGVLYGLTRHLNDELRARLVDLSCSDPSPAVRACALGVLEEP